MKIIICLVIFGISVISGYGEVAYAEESPNDNSDFPEILGDIESAKLRVDLWPVNTDDPVGIVFTQSDYEMLGPYEIKKDETTLFREGPNVIIGDMGIPFKWDETDLQYSVCVSRTIELRLAKDNEADDNTIILEIVVAPDNRIAKEILVLEIASKRVGSCLQSQSVWGPDHDVTAGEILTLNDTDLDNRIESDDWSGNMARDISCIHNNILINIIKSMACEVELPQLASSMVEKLVAQEALRVANEGSLRPTVSFSISQTSIDFPAMDAADDYKSEQSVDMTVDVSNWSGTTSQYGFNALKVHPETGVDENGKAVYDDSRNTYYPNDDDSSFDDVSKPTKCVFHRTTGSTPESFWHVGVVVWGDNLMPAEVAFRELTIVRGK